MNIMDIHELEDELFKLEQTTATLGMVQTAFADGESIPDNEETAASLYLLYFVQRGITKKIRELIERQ